MDEIGTVGQGFFASEEGMILAAIAAIFVVSALLVAVVVAGISRRLNPKVLRTGKAASAIVRQLEQTGTRINGVWVYKLEVEVQPEGSAPFRAWVRRTIPIHQIQQAQPGETVTVRYNPERPEKEIALAALGFDAESTLSSEELVALLTRQQEVYKRLNAEGLPATAIVVGLTDLGHRVNRIAAVCRLRLKVIGGDGKPFDAELIAPIHQERLGRYEVGAEVPVRIDRRSPTTVTIDASRGVSVNPGDDPRPPSN